MGHLHYSTILMYHLLLHFIATAMRAKVCRTIIVTFLSLVLGLRCSTGSPRRAISLLCFLTVFYREARLSQARPLVVTSTGTIALPE